MGPLCLVDQAAKYMRHTRLEMIYFNHFVSSTHLSRCESLTAGEK